MLSYRLICTWFKVLGQQRDLKMILISVKGHSWSINVIESLVHFWCYHLFDQSQWQQEIHSDVGEQLNILKKHGQNLAIIVLPNILAFWCWQVTSQPYKKLIVCCEQSPQKSLYSCSNCWSSLLIEWYEFKSHTTAATTLWIILEFREWP